MKTTRAKKKTQTELEYEQLDAEMTESQREYWKKAEETERKRG